MLLRNSRVFFLAIAPVFISLSGFSQIPASSGASSPPTSSTTTQRPSENQPVGQAQATGQPQASQPAPQGSEPTQAQPSGNQAGQSGQTAPPASQGQAPENDQGDNGVFVFKKEVEEVTLHATVVDEKMRLITNLDKTAFTVYENNQPQAITSFRHEDVPVAMGIVIDNSGSMREKREEVNKAALNLVRSSNPDDQVFVVNFNDEFYLDQDYTSNIKKLGDALEKVESRGGTALYDALVASSDYLKQSKLQKRVLFVVTDGEDNASRDTLEEAVKRLSGENGPTVYAIGLLGEEKQRRARRAIQTLAERTGGIAFLPRTLGEVDDISRTVAHDIRNQYTIGYKPTSPRSAGGYRTIHVTAMAKGDGKLTVRTRSGYYPGQEPPPGGMN
ncbi:MAG TPA: VWA domain-containing protein [Terriglobales bacterium]|nr:VWA domain-containing protein [Terriglobales bacterium]